MSFDLELQLINKIFNILILSLFLNMLRAWVKESNTLNKRGDSCKIEVKHRLLIKEGISYDKGGKMKTLNKRGGLSQ